MDKTPIQEAIEKFERISEKEQHSFRKAYWTSAVQHLKLLLPKEREFVGKIFDKGFQQCCNLRNVDQSDLYDKQQFINQLYPKP